MTITYATDSSDSMMWLLLVKVVDLLREIDFNAREPRRDISDNDIFIMKSVREKRHLKDLAQLPKPCIIVTPIEINTPLNAGNTSDDDSIHRIAVFILDKDYDTRHGGLRTWTKWQYQISRKLRWYQFARDIEITNESYVSQVRLRSIETLEDVSWDTKDTFKSGVMIDVLARESRHVEP
tara:strand:- start:4895 stop:5434 length:540 start_codon:yes stop_codon:yes gene_type:complete